jgi:hypothetical protein
MLARKAFFGVSLHKASFVCIKQVRVEARLLGTFKKGRRAITLIIIESSTKPSFLYPPSNNYYLDPLSNYIIF